MEKNNFLKKNNHGQVTIFIIAAIALIAGIVLYLVLREGFSIVNVPASIQPVYNTFTSCVEEQTLIGINLLESQAGYIELPQFEPGSSYMPFGSQLNLLGNPIPYWYYVSGNNVQKEQIPTESDMENSLADFIDSRISSCNFDSYYEDGFEINLGESSSSVDIKDNNVVVNMNLELSVSRANDSAIVSRHNLQVNSNLYSLYNSAKKVYEKEQSELFLENYGVDIMRLYAPVDGVELSCSPQVWNAEEVFAELKEAIEINTLALSSENPTTKAGKYFNVDANIPEGVRFINSQDWANSFEVNPSDGILLISEPVGVQSGLGILGFCYVPYHFVYNINYPVLVQIYDGNEIFQFPLAVVIQGNVPRESLDATANEIDNVLCENKNSLTSVNIYNGDLEPVDAEISYECFGTSCYIGKTSSGNLDSEFPQCVNGYVIVRAEGYEEIKYLHSSVDSGSVDIIMNKLYELNLDLRIGGAKYNGDALIYFTSDDNSVTVSYPQQTKVNLSEGDYAVSVYAYKNSSIRLQQTTSEQCIEVARSGVGGLLGFTEEKCFDITVPEQIISNVLAGGGKENYSVSDGELRTASTIIIDADAFKIPTTIEAVQENHLLAETSGMGVYLQ